MSRLRRGEKVTAASVCHCGREIEPRDPDPWEGRMDDYCYDCATNRCDCYPDECPVKYPSAARPVEPPITIESVTGRWARLSNGDSVTAIPPAHEMGRSFDDEITRFQNDPVSYLNTHPIVDRVLAWRPK